MPNGKLGIGTENPQAQLHTTGTVRLSNYDNGFLRVDSEGNLFTEDFVIPTVLWTQNSDGSIYNTGLGKVGVGVQIPMADLHINGQTLSKGYGLELGNELNYDGSNHFITNVPMHLINPDYTGNYLGIGVGNAGNNTGGIIFITPDVVGDPQPRMVITPDGMVGIGTFSPKKMLHVCHDRIILQNPDPKPPINKIDADTMFMKEPIFERDSIITNTEQRGSMRLELNIYEGSTSNYVHESSTWDIQPAIRSKYKGMEVPPAMHFIESKSGHTVMTLQENGAVGIGTISPTARLHVNGGDFKLTNGRLGIGVDRPVADLDVKGSIFASDEISTGLINAFEVVKIGTETSVLELDINMPVLCIPGVFSWANIRTNSWACGSGIKFFTNTQSSTPKERMQIAPNGYVGIGTNDPKSTLHVNGNIISKDIIDFAYGPFVNSNIPLSISDNNSNNTYQSIIAIRNNAVSYDEGLKRLGISFNLSGEENLNESEKMGAITLETDNNWSNFPSLNFWTKNEKRLTILNNGKVGIGTSSPEAFLHLALNQNCPFLLLENNSIPIFAVSATGKVQVRDDLYVEGVIKSAVEVVVETFTWADFVLEPDYDLEAFTDRMEIIKLQKHLPNIYPESKILKNGIPISETLQGLLQNMEEMYLYMDQMQNKIDELNKKLIQIETENIELKAKFNGK
ncbi:MAG: hypothetical protein PHP52_10645 [Bacteroidales bacterium]|nr:hypothetical protein [Bacteroidales bacterium]